jgi:hypothetical protein
MLLPSRYLLKSATAVAVTAIAALSTSHTLLAQPSAKAVAGNEGANVRVIASEFGLVYYPGGANEGGFRLKPAKVIAEKDSYYGWLVRVTCPPGAEFFKWKSITTLPAPDKTSTPGVFKDDPSITISADLKSYTTERQSLCQNGTARIDDLYGRDSSEPLGPWKIEVFHKNERLAEFSYAIAKHYEK